MKVAWVISQGLSGDAIEDPAVVNRVQRNVQALRRNQSLKRMDMMLQARYEKRRALCERAFSKFQRRFRAYLLDSEIERGARDTLKRLVRRKRHSTVGKRIFAELKAEKKANYAAAVHSTIMAIKRRLIVILRAWGEYAHDYATRRIWLARRVKQKHALRIEDLLADVLKKKQDTRAAVLGDLGPTLTRCMSRYRSSAWDWAVLLRELNAAFFLHDPQEVYGAVLRQSDLGLNRINPLQLGSEAEEFRLLRLLGVRAPRKVHIGLEFVLLQSTLSRRIAVPPPTYDPLLFDDIEGGEAGGRAREVGDERTARSGSVYERVRVEREVSKTSAQNKRLCCRSGIGGGNLASPMSPSTTLKDNSFAAKVRAQKSKANALQTERTTTMVAMLKEMEPRAPVRMPMDPMAKDRARKAEDARVHRFLTFSFWVFVQSCDDFFSRCREVVESANSARTAEEERAMLREFLCHSLNARKGHLPAFPSSLEPRRLVLPFTVRASPTGAARSEGAERAVEHCRPFWHWIQAAERCQECNLMRMQRKGTCDHCGANFDVHYAAPTMATTARANELRGDSRYDAARVEQLREPFADLLYHAALAVLAPVGSWRRQEPLHAVWAGSVGLAKPIVTAFSMSGCINSIGDLALLRHRLYALAGPSAGTQHDLVIAKTLEFLAVLDELICDAQDDQRQLSKAHLVTVLPSIVAPPRGRGRSTRRGGYEAPSDALVFEGLSTGSLRRTASYAERVRKGGRELTQVEAAGHIAQAAKVMRKHVVGVPCARRAAGDGVRRGSAGAAGTEEGKVPGSDNISHGP